MKRVLIANQVYSWAVLPLLGGQLQSKLLPHGPAGETANSVRLPVGGLHPIVQCGSLRPTQQRQDGFCLCSRTAGFGLALPCLGDLAAFFERRKVSLVSVAESLDTGSAAGRLVIDIMTAVSQWEREAIGERTRDAMRHKRAKQERVGNIAYGYRLADDGKHLEPHPDEQRALSEIRRLRHTGHSMRRVASELNRQDLRTRRGTAWRLEHIARILKPTTHHA